MKDPDASAAGFLTAPLDALRYDGQSMAPQEVASMIVALIPPCARVLDVGCGTGSISRIIVNTRGARLVGIEPDAQRAAVARTRGVDVHAGVLTPELLKRVGRFDVVVFADVLEHVPDPARLLQLARCGLTPGGAVIASIPNVAHWSVRVDLLCGRFDYASCGIRDATHLRWFTARTVRTLFESNGWRINSLRQTAGVTLPEYFSRRPWRWLSRRTRDPLIRALTRGLPLLFGCQHIVHATPV
jgi:methionine biosynthesis protein MetW